MINSMNALTSKFREILVTLEKEGQEYRKEIADLKKAGTNLSHRRHIRLNSEGTLNRATPATNLTSSLTNNQITTSTASSSLGRPQLRDNTSQLRARNHCSLNQNYHSVHPRTSDPNCRHHAQRHHRIMSTPITRGALIVLEGLDRVGKSTLAKKLVEHLERMKRDVSLCRFPDRATPVGQLIDEFLKTSTKRIDNHVMHLLFSANRWELAKRIRNTINQGITVVVDRYSYSGIAYSSAKQDMDFKWCREMERGLPRPDLVIYLELPREAQYQRPGFGGERFETMEMQDMARLQYEHVMEMSNETWLRVDVERKNPDQVLGEIIIPVKRCLESCANKELGDLDFLET